MPSNSPAPERDKPKYAKDSVGNATVYMTVYEGDALYVVQRMAAESRDGRWAVYRRKDDRGGTLDDFIAQGRTRDAAVFAAMDKTDERDPAKPLKDRFAAAWWIKAGTSAYPEAMEFQPVRSGHDGTLLGWTFWVSRSATLWFGWVSVDRQFSKGLEEDREKASAMLQATLGAQALGAVPVPAAEPVADAAPVVEVSPVVTGRVVGKGVRPKDESDPATAAAVAALAGLKLAEVTDAFEVGEPETFGRDRGAVVMPSWRDSSGSRVFGMWLENGAWDRPYDPARNVPLLGMAERWAKAGFTIEFIERGVVSALYRPPVEEDGEAATEYTDVWSLASRGGVEIAVVEAKSYDRMMGIAEHIRQVRSAVEGDGLLRRRLSRAEVERRDAEHSYLYTHRVHHCMERGHLQCGGGIQLDGPPAEVPVPPRETPGLERAATWAKGARVLGIDGQVHEVWHTYWRPWDGVEVEHVTTADGRDMRARDLTAWSSGMLRIETDAHKGDTAAERSPVLGWRPLADVIPKGHGEVQRAGVLLESFRRNPGPHAHVFLSAAAEAARWAAAHFRAATCGLTVEMWRAVARYAVEISAASIRLGRPHALDAEPGREGFFGSDRRTLEDRSPVAHGKIMSAGRYWARYMEDEEKETYYRYKTDRAIRYAAHELAETYGGTEEAWIVPVRYLAELRAMLQMDETAYRQGVKKA